MPPFLALRGPDETRTLLGAGFSLDHAVELVRGELEAGAQEHRNIMPGSSRALLSDRW